MLVVSRPIVPDFEQFSNFLRLSFDHGRFTNGGPLLSMLELKLRELTAARHLCLVANGTIALELALRALGVKGEVITTPFTFCATSHAISWTGGVPVFVDVDPDRLTIDPASIEMAITPRTEAILGVHIYGQPCDVVAIRTIAEKHGLAVIYDGAHAFNSSRNGTPIGHYGDATTYSFHATKLFHTGEGGAIETGDQMLADKLRLLRNFGIESEDAVSECGTNAKMSELSAAMGLAVFEKIGSEHAARLTLRSLYEDLLRDTPGIRICNVADPSAAAMYFIIRIDVSDDPTRRDRIQAALKSQGILSRKYFYPLVSEAPFYSAASDLNKTPVAYRASREVLALPFHSGVTEVDLMKITKTIKSLSKETSNTISRARLSRCMTSRL